MSEMCNDLVWSVRDVVVGVQLVGGMRDQFFLGVQDLDVRSQSASRRWDKFVWGVPDLGVR